MTIPDLRPEMTEITLEHCSTLLEHFGKVFEALSEDELSARELQEICDQINPIEMLAEIDSIFTPEAFMRLFRTPLGKGVIIGAYAQHFIIDGNEIRE